MSGKIVRKSIMNKYFQLLFSLSLLGIFFISPVLSYDFSNYKNVNGVLNVIVVPVEFADTLGSSSITTLNKQVFENVRGYFQTVSYGKISLIGEIYDSWITLPENMSFYGYWGGENDHNTGAFRLIMDVIHYVDPLIDFSSYDFILIVHSGEDEAVSQNSTDIRSWGYWENLGAKTQDDLIFNQGAVISEFSSLGMFCHEFGHVLGLPDLYNTDKNSSTIFVGKWGLMGLGNYNGDPLGSKPSHIMGWGKMFLGWINTAQIVEINANQPKNFTIFPLENAGNGIKLIKILTEFSDYFFCEFRIDKNLPETGVLITRINESLETGKGIVEVVDSNPLTSSLNDATLGVGDIYEDETNGFSVRLLDIVENNSATVEISNKFYLLVDVNLPKTVSTNEEFTVSVDVSNLRGKPLEDLPVSISCQGQKSQTMSNSTGIAEFKLKFDLLDHGIKNIMVEVEGDGYYYSNYRSIQLDVAFSFELALAISIVLVILVILLSVFLRKRNRKTPQVF